jgi:glycosyltransferase involved in cell wall biosynthesis
VSVHEVHNGSISVLHTVRSLRVDGVVKVILRYLADRSDPALKHYVCSLRDEDDLADEFRASGIELIFLGHTGPYTVGRTVRRLVKCIRQLDIDLVHANRTIDLALAGLAAKRCGIPVVSTIHWLGRLEEHPEDAAQVPWIRRWLEMNATVVLNRLLATRIVAVSDAVRASYGSLRGFPRERMQVVYPGLAMTDAQDTRVEENLRNALGIDDDAPILLNVGRLHSVKGQLHLIPMMSLVRERLPKAKLLIAGEGELRPALTSAIAKAKLEDAIALLGTRTDVDALLGISDVLVLSSESEAAPLPLLEAMRAGRPVVATAVGGVREIVREGTTGYVVPRADPAAMAAAVLRILGDPREARRMGDAARALARERFDIASSRKALQRLYGSLVPRA